MDAFYLDSGLACARSEGGGRALEYGVGCRGRVQGVGCRMWGVWCRVHGVGSRVKERGEFCLSEGCGRAL